MDGILPRPDSVMNSGVAWSLSRGEFRPNFPTSAGKKLMLYTSIYNTEMARTGDCVSVVIDSSGVLCSEQSRFARTMVFLSGQRHGITRSGGPGFISWIDSSDNALMCDFR